MADGVPVAVCSTSNERAVSAIVRVLLGPDVAAAMRVFAGDVVPKKKPDPAIYLLAASELGVNPARCAPAQRPEAPAERREGLSCSRDDTDSGTCVGSPGVAAEMGGVQVHGDRG